MTSTNNKIWDTIVIGAGAAGLMCAIEIGKREKNVLLVEHAKKVGKKILISGGGRCNFTNIHASPSQYLSKNEHFCKSALARYTPRDFIELVEQHGISYHEKKLGQLFCDSSARDIVGMLLTECEHASVAIELNCSVDSVKQLDTGEFVLGSSSGELVCGSLVIATGGLSIPKMGATDFGHRTARKFGLKLTETKAALVPFTFSAKDLKHFQDLSGISIDAEVSFNNVSFRENILITHKGVSGPAILQISSYWQSGQSICLNLLPNTSIADIIERNSGSNREIKTILTEYLPKRFVARVFEVWLKSKPINSLSQNDIEKLSNFFHSWTITPSGTEGYRTAEVTVGGVDVGEISSKTFESKKVPGLYFIGEVLDVTGWLGGYNFQWAWASGYCAGQYA